MPAFPRKIKSSPTCRRRRFGVILQGGNAPAGIQPLFDRERKPASQDLSGISVIEFETIVRLLASVIVGYLLGSIPFAHLVARRRGIDIFATGSTRAGTANVFWNISRRNGVLVFAADAIKGALAIAVARLLDVEEPALILAGAAAVVGHWKSIFTRFRGGDGMVTLAGATLALVPWLAVLGVAIGICAVLLTRRSPFRSSFGIAACFLVLLAVSQSFPQFQDERLLVLELSALALLVIFHNVLIHRRRAPLLASGRNKSGGETEFHVLDDADLDPDFPEDC